MHLFNSLPRTIGQCADLPKYEIVVRNGNFRISGSNPLFWTFSVMSSVYYSTINTVAEILVMYTLWIYLLTSRMLKTCIIHNSNRKKVRNCRNVFFATPCASLLYVACSTEKMGWRQWSAGRSSLFSRSPGLVGIRLSLLRSTFLPAALRAALAAGI